MGFGSACFGNAGHEAVNVWFVLSVCVHYILYIPCIIKPLNLFLPLFIIALQIHFIIYLLRGNFVGAEGLLSGQWFLPRALCLGKKHTD